MKLRWKRGIAVLLTAVMLLSMPGGLELTAAAVETVQEAEQSAVQLADNEYELTFASYGQTVTGYTGTPVDVVVPDGVTAIGSGAFQSCESLISITLPDSVETLEASAFSGCTALESVTFAKRRHQLGVQNIPEQRADHGHLSRGYDGSAGGAVYGERFGIRGDSRRSAVHWPLIV